MIVILKFWREILILLLFLSSMVLLFMFVTQEERNNLEVEILKERHSRLLEEQEKKSLIAYNKELEKVRDKEKQEQKKLIESLERAKQREKDLSNHIRTTDDVVDRLHDTIRRSYSNTNTYTREAEDRLRIAQQVSLQECTAALRDLESDAIRLANTVREFDERWPEGREYGTDISVTEDIEERRGLR